MTEPTQVPEVIANQSNQVQVSNIQAWLNGGGKLKAEALRPEVGIHHNALLRHDEWLEIDQAVLDTVKTGLVGISDLISAGLTKKLGGLGTMLSAYEQLSDMTEADVSLEGVTQGQDDRVTFTPQFVPIPIIHKDFSISLRHLLASRNNGEGLDTTQARAATRVVKEKMEEMLFNGITKELGGYKIYGYTNAPHRISDTAVGDFGTAGNAYKTFVKAIGAFAALGFDGPFNAYLSTNQYNELLNLLGSVNDYNELTVITRQLPQIASVKRSFNIVDGSMVMVQMTADVVDLAVAEDVTPVQWDELGGMLTRFRIMTALAPRIKFDANNHCGVLHYTGA
jgi:uncharacterized linocin/CFP29 family protein